MSFTQLRDCWEFRFTGEEILQAVEAKLDRHIARANYWSSLHEKAVAKVDAAAVETVKQEHTGGHSYSIKVDQTLVDEMDRTSRKRDHHQGKVDVLQSWGVLFRRELGRTFELTVTDAEFFGLID